MDEHRKTTRPPSLDVAGNVLSVVGRDLAKSRHIAPEHIGAALDAFHEHAAKLPPDELAAAGAMVDGHADAFFSKHAAEHPDRARKRKPAPKTW
jgi:hypothetical protein